jgi:hypothetical protein
MLENNEGIKIRQVANGYLVEAIKLNNVPITDEETAYVFQSFEEMIAWLARHFTHREQFIKADPQLVSRDSAARIDTQGNITFNSACPKISGWKINQSEMPPEPRIAQAWNIGDKANFDFNGVRAYGKISVVGIDEVTVKLNGLEDAYITFRVCKPMEDKQ